MLLGLVLVNLYVFLWRGGTSIPDVMEQAAVASGEGEPSAAAQPAHDEPEEGDSAEPPSPSDERGGEPDDPGRWVESEVQDGDSLHKILKREGLTPPEAEAVIRALGSKMDLRSIKVGQRYRLHFDDAGTLTELEFHISRISVARVKRDLSGEMVCERTDAETKIEPVEIGGTITSSLYQAVKDAGEDTSLVGFYVDVFAYDLNFYIDTHQGDTFRMIVEKEYLDGQFLRYRNVLAAEYKGLAGTFRAFYWMPPGAKEGRYFDEKGQSIEKTFLKTPLKYARISSGFNPRRMHPILHVRRGHMGVDFAAPTGTPVWAAAPGVITFRGRRGGAGNCVILKHDNGFQTTYMHLSKFRKGQDVGKRVRAKDVIGYVGMTGLATGPHLHFSVKQGGRYVDPMKIKMSRGASVAKKDRPAFEKHIGGWVSRLASVGVTGGARASAVSAPASGWWSAASP
ncbi:MAG TPA: peptidoglycan DD-metalloendopeptidase family protein [Kofleriaceae bacterium]|nr:peptidoglycan DD-metalloendopeptidase family protein [Kofleriaceae bacterium]